MRQLFIILLIFFMFGCATSNFKTENKYLSSIDYVIIMDKLSGSDSLLLNNILTEASQSTLDSLTISYNNPFSPSSMLELLVTAGDYLKLFALDASNKPLFKVIIKEVKQGGIINLPRSDIELHFKQDPPYKFLIFDKNEELIGTAIMW